MTSQRAAQIQTDRRRHVRVAAPGVASHFQTRDISLAGLAVENLSSGGMFVRCPSTLAVGTRGMVQIVRQGLRTIFALGCVTFVISPDEARRRGAAAGMGVRLDPVDLDAARRLDELVDDLAAAADRAAIPLQADTEVEGPRTRPSAPTPEPSVDTSTEDHEARNRLIQQLEEEIVVLRRELVRRNRTIQDLGARLAAYEAEARNGALRPTRVVDPRSY